MIIGDMFRAASEITSLNDIQSWAVSSARGIAGLVVIFENRENPPRPEQPITLYGLEGCPYCRKVRDALTTLDLSYISRSHASRDSTRVPYLVDPNTSTELYESEDIITYLQETYGNGRKGLTRVLAPANTMTSILASGLRGKGRRVRAEHKERAQPEEMLTIYNIEASPYCRKVREVLTELNLDAQIENVGKKSARRPELVARGGKMMIPYLIDPNTGVEMYESDEIVEYLQATYG